MSVGRRRWTWRSMSSTACWSWDARPTSASPEPRQGWGNCARIPDPCTTARHAPIKKRSPNMAPQLLNVGLGRTDHALAKIGQQVLLAVVAVDLQEPLYGAGEVEHAWLLLHRQNDGLHRHRGEIGHEGAQFLQHAFGIRDVCNDKPGHARKQRDRLSSVSGCWALEIEGYRQAATIAQLVP